MFVYIFHAEKKRLTLRVNTTWVGGNTGLLDLLRQSKKKLLACGAGFSQVDVAPNGLGRS
jgi:hypothetical protein